MTPTVEEEHQVQWQQGGRLGSKVRETVSTKVRNTIQINTKTQQERKQNINIL